MAEVSSGYVVSCSIFHLYVHVGSGRCLQGDFSDSVFGCCDVISVVLVNGRLDKATAMRQKELAEFSPKPIANADAKRSWFYRQYKDCLLQLSLAICCTGLTVAGSSVHVVFASCNV